MIKQFIPDGSNFERPVEYTRLLDEVVAHAQAREIGTDDGSRQPRLPLEDHAAAREP